MPIVGQQAPEAASGRAHAAPASQQRQAAPHPAGHAASAAPVAPPPPPDQLDAMLARAVAARDIEPGRPRGPLLLRMAIAEQKVKVADLSIAEAKRYVAIWRSRKESENKVVFDSDQEVLDLVFRSLADEDVGAKVDASRRTLDEQSSALLAVMHGYAGLSYAVTRIENAVARAREEATSAVPKNWQFAVSTHDYDSRLEADVRAVLERRAAIYERAIKTVVTTAANAGLPALDAHTVADFRRLESVRQRARDLRAPIDIVLRRHVPVVERLIPGATIVYRGSLARGVKSPSKFVNVPGVQGSALAEFDALNVHQAKSKDRQAVVSAQASYDIDASIEVPRQQFNALGLRAELGDRESGPLPMGSRNRIVRALIELQGLIRGELERDLSDALPGLDAEDFAFFITTSEKASSQLDVGNPYPPFMLENAGFRALAAQLPRAYARELVGKLREYYTAHMCLPHDYVRPFDEWEPFYVELYDHVRLNGPTAVFMPEVQVEPKTSKEWTQEAEPRDTGDVHGPYDVLAADRKALTHVARTLADVVVGRAFIGEVTGFAERGAPRSFVKIGTDVRGNSISCVCFNAGRQQVRWRGVYVVRSLPTRRGDLPVVDFKAAVR